MKKTLLSLCAVSLLSACSGPAIKDTAIIQQTALNQAQNSEQNPQEVIENTRNTQIKAQQQDLYYYSPSYMAQAEVEMAKAEESLKQNKPASTTITHSLTAQALFDRGLATKDVVINQLKSSFDGIEMLKEINSHTLLKGDFEDIQDDIKDLILLIEQNKTSDALNEQKEVLSDITELEIQTLKVTYFSSAENALEKAEDADAEEYAAKTFESAEKALEKLELTVENQYKDRELLAQKSTATIQLAQHAEHVAKAAKPLLKLDAEKAEQHILYVESLLERVTKALNHDAITHMPLNNQSIALAQAVERLNKQAQTNINTSQWALEKQQLETVIAELKQAQLDAAPKASETNQEQEQASNTEEADNTTALTPATATDVTPAKNQEDSAAQEAPVNTLNDTLKQDTTDLTNTALKTEDTPSTDNTAALEAVTVEDTTQASVETEQTPASEELDAPETQVTA